MNISFDDKNSANTTENNFHSIPCTINFNGKGSIDKYFKPYVCTGKDGVLNGSLRGTQMSGEKVETPKGYSAVVLKEVSTLNNDKILKDQGRTKSFVFWKTDARPHSGDILRQAFQYIDDANEIHL